jgi:hypothetical protein
MQQATKITVETSRNMRQGADGSDLRLNLRRQPEREGKPKCKTIAALLSRCGTEPQTIALCPSSEGVLYSSGEPQAQVATLQAGRKPCGSRWGLERRGPADALGPSPQQRGLVPMRSCML